MIQLCLLMGEITINNPLLNVIKENQIEILVTINVQKPLNYRLKNYDKY